MGALYGLARMTTATTSTGTITLGAAVSGFLTFAQAGVPNGATVSYAIRDGANSEEGEGVYTSAGTTLTRSVRKSTNSDAAINLSGTAEVAITIGPEDFLWLTAAQTVTAARMKQGLANLGVDQVTTHGDSAYTILTTDRYVATSAAFTASRTWTLPAANGVTAGFELTIADVAAALTSTNTLVVARAGSDTINGSSSSITLLRTYSWIRLRSDGSSKWTIVGCDGVARVTVYTSGSGTHTTLPGCGFMDVEMAGGGGGGGGSGASPGTPTGGGTTTFGSSFLTCTGGAAGTYSSGTFWAVGGTATGGDINIIGGYGIVTNESNGQGTAGGGCPLGNIGNGGPPGVGQSATGQGYGAGGGGAGPVASGGGNISGGGGGAYLRKLIIGPASSYAYAVGAAGSLGSQGTGGTPGNPGAPGVIIIRERVGCG